MKKEFKAKEIEKLIGCTKHFIPGITKKWNSRQIPIFKPTRKGTQGETSFYTKNDVVLLAVIHEARKFGLQRDWINYFKKVIKNHGGEIVLRSDNETIKIEIDLDKIVSKIDEKIKLLD